MIERFYEIHDFLVQKTIKIINSKLFKVIESFNFVHFSDKTDQHKIINENIQKSKVIIINQYKNKKQDISDLYFIVVFSNTVMILNQSSIPFLNQFFSARPDLNIVTLSDTKNILQKNSKIFEEEISNFKDQFFYQTTRQISTEHIELWNCIQYSISAYLIHQSYQKQNRNRIDDLISSKGQKNSPLIINPNDYFTLRIVGIGSNFLCELIYHIESGELFVIKKPSNSDSQFSALIDRQLNNYSHLRHPFLARFIGLNKRDNYIITEYIDGQNLSDIKNSLEEKNKFSIIFEMMLAIEYIHHNNLIYRDLKPDNIIIDKSNTVVLIDFDRMIYEIKEKFTCDFQTDFAAPEINFGKISTKSDIYSIGKMIKYIIDVDKYPALQQIFIKCTKENVNERPTILELIVDFYINFYSMIEIHHFFKNNEEYFLQVFENNIFNKLKNIENNHDKSLVSYEIAEIYENGYYVQKDIEKAIHFYFLSSEQNNSNAQYKIGFFYFKGLYLQQNEQKALHYFSLSADQNNKDGQFSVGYMYFEGIFVQKDIKKAFEYFFKAADQGHAKAQHNVGTYYYDIKYNNKDIKKAIYYFTLAAEQNISESQYLLGYIFSIENDFIDVNKALKYLTLSLNQNNKNAQCQLGFIYYEGKIVDRNITKAIHYFTLAADNNNGTAQFNLGLIYYNGKYVKRNLEKAIYYLTISADQNDCDAQLFLGEFYSKNNFYQFNINKAINYYKLAANQNNENAQIMLGSFYYDGNYISRDIDKAIYYYTLAAKNNNPEAQFFLGNIFYKGLFTSPDNKKALYYYNLSASQNYAPAQYNLGVLYEKGEIVPFDIKKAIHFYSLAAKQNNSDACYNLAVIYYEGKYIARDINLAIKYYSIASKQNNVMAQVNLGFIYYNGNYVVRDIPKAIYYFQIAADQNVPEAQFNLGVIYSEKKNNQYDISKAIKYFKLASDSNLAKAQYSLALIYYEGELIERDISKAIHYFELAADQRLYQAQFYLAQIYFYGKYVKKDINKFFYYIQLVADQNHIISQYILGVFYFYGYNGHLYRNKGLYYLTQSSMKGNVQANFAIGYIYHDKKFKLHNIQKAIHHYKEASSFNNQFAKNNLGVIYKNGFEDEIKKDLPRAIEYFKEAINQNNDLLSMINLASIYIFDKSFEMFFDEAIDLLIMSSERGFIYSKVLLCLVLLEKFDFYIVGKKNEIMKKIKMSDSLFNSICVLIEEKRLDELNSFNAYYQFFSEVVFLYNSFFRIIPSNDSFNIESNENKRTDINSEFYEGFGII